MLASTLKHLHKLMLYAIWSSKYNAIGSKRYTDLNEAIVAAKETAKRYHGYTVIKRLTE